MIIKKHNKNKNKIKNTYQIKSLKHQSVQTKKKYLSNE